MTEPSSSRLASALGRMQWARGLRAGLVLAAIAAICALRGWPLGWASVGGFLSVIVDNGGPYRSRLANIATLLAGGALAILAGNLGSRSLVLSIAVTAIFCFAVTFSRTATQALASVSVAILVCYFASFGSGALPFHAVLLSILFFLSGGLLGASVVLFFWPADPFGPARLAVADVYANLTLLAAHLTEPHSPESRRREHELHAHLRSNIEAAHYALASTGARTPSRTVRARNLTVLLQSADLLFARVLRISELHETAGQIALREHREAIARWLTSSLSAIAPALRHQPHDSAAAFAPEGSLSVELHRRVLRFESPTASDPVSTFAAQYDAHLAALERDCLLNLEVSYEAVRAIWTGAEPRVSRAATFRSSLSATLARTPNPWLDALQTNFTVRSIMMRHAIRLAIVAVADVLIMRRVHISHGYWLAMTSIIVLQPYAGQTVRRFLERVGGTVAGGILAAVLAAALPNEPTLMVVVITFAMLSAAVYTVDYGWYCFFLTPTFVLLALPQLRDWHFALIRVGTTCAGAATAVLAMLILWRERESRQLPRLLSTAASADRAYLRAMLTFWQGCSQPPAQRTQSERTLLAPARRACGLATTEAEESLDRALQEPTLTFHRGEQNGSQPLNQAALTFTTYLRRFTQSITTLAAFCEEAPRYTPTIATLAARLDTLIAALQHPHASALPPAPPEPPLTVVPAPAPSLAAQQLRRMERQVAILERAAAEINAAIQA